MNKIIFILFLACLLVPNGRTSAQTHRKGISIEDITTGLSDNMLDIGFTVKASGMKIRNNEQLQLSFAIENDQRRMVLPPVVYSGAKRYRYERRRAILSQGYEGEPYAVYRRIRRNRNYRTDYTLSVPFDTWMETAAVTYRGIGDIASGEGVLIANVIPTPYGTWEPDSLLFPRIVSFLIPETSEKTRVSMLELNIGYPRGATDIHLNFEGNRVELARVDSLIRKLLNNDMIRIDRVDIRGYASPDGSYAANERLARGRSEGFKQYLARTYPDSPHIRNAATSWVAEDWETLGKLVESNSAISQKRDVLSIVYDSMSDSDAKERMLQTIAPWSQNYGIIVREIYPRLRRIELKVNYTIRRLDSEQARKLLHTNPDMLSLEEIYRVAAFYDPGSDGYGAAYRIAAREYPDDLTANNNAAAALLQEGNAEAAWPYLLKIGETPYTYINYGAYYYIKGEREKAIEFFNRAKQVGIAQGQHNLDLIGE